MVFPTNPEELREFLIEVLNTQQAAAGPAAVPMPQPGVSEAREIVARAEGALEMLRTREDAMTQSEEQMLASVAALQAEVVA